MFNLEKFIADSVTSRLVSMFVANIEANRKTLIAEIKNKKVCVIGGAGSIGSSFIKAVLRFEPKSVLSLTSTRTDWLSWFVMCVLLKDSMCQRSSAVTSSILQILSLSVSFARRKVSIL